MTRKFKWDSWDFDCSGEAYIIARQECPNKVDVPDYIIREDHLHQNCKDGMVVEEGWCKFQVRTDWENGNGKPSGGYVIEKHEPKGKPGWFPVWIVRKGEWY